MSTDFAAPPVPPPVTPKKSRKWMLVAGFVAVAVVGIAIGGTSAGSKPPVQAAAPAPVTVTAEAPPAVTVTAPVTVTAAAPPAATTSAHVVGSGPAAVGTPVSFSSSSPHAEGIATLNSATWTTAPSDFEPYVNGAGLMIDVTVESTVGTTHVNPLYFQARDAAGRVYKTLVSEVPGADPALTYGDITTGLKTRGFVVIDAPQGPMTVEFTDIWGTVLATWTVA